jgi:hypothetical protein
MEKRNGKEVPSVTPKKKIKKENDIRKWETGEDLIPISLIKKELDSDDDIKVDKTKKKNQKRGVKAKKKDADSEFIDNYISSPVYNRLASLSIEDKNYTNGTTIMQEYSEYERIPEFSHRPLNDWLHQYGGNGNGKTSNYISEEISNDIQKHYDQVSKKDISNMTKQEFYSSDYDPYDDQFGLHPMLYEMFSILNIEEDFIEKQTFLKEGRKTFINKKPVNYKMEALEEIDKIYATSYLIEARGKEFGERQCFYKQKCIFMILPISYPDQVGSLDGNYPEDSFICKEFLLPSEEKIYTITGELPPQVHPCLGCNILRTTFAWYYYNKNKKEPLEHLQNHYYKVADNPLLEDDSTFNEDHCIYPSTVENKWNGISRPFLKFSANKFIFGKRKKVINSKTLETTDLKCANFIGINFR